MTYDPWQMIAGAVVVCGASMLKGAIGFGFPLVAVPLLSTIIGPRTAIPVVAIPTLLSNFLVVRRGGAGGEGAGMVALLYVLATAGRLTLKVPAAAGNRAGPIIGVLAGLMGGSTGISSPLLASYLHFRRLAKREFVFWITMMFFVVNIVQVASYFKLGLYPSPVLTGALAACLPMAAGTLAGLALQDRLPARLFERIVLTVVFLAALNLLAGSLFS